MVNKVSRNEVRKIRHARVRSKISGTPEVPRLNVFRSNSNISVQIIDDVNAVTLVSASSLDKSLKIENGSNIEAAKIVVALDDAVLLESDFAETVFGLFADVLLEQVRD